MPLWRIEPVADSSDSRWLDHEIWREVVVRASSPAMARLLAADLERRGTAETAPAGNESLSFQSAFEDEKLYRVSQVDPAELPDIPDAGPDEVVRQERRIA